MRLLRIFSSFLCVHPAQGNAVPLLDKIEFSRLSKISRGLISAYSMPKGRFYRHALYSTIFHTVKEHSALFADIEPVTLQWTEKKGDPSCGKVIFAEHGWLPRSNFQLSSQGCNSRSHLKFDSESDYIGALGGYEVVQRVKRSLCRGFCSPCACDFQFVERPFILVALQTGTDFNLLYSGTPFARFYMQEQATAKLGQAVIDYLESVPTRFPLVFTQHPSDMDRLPFTVNPENRIVYAGKGGRTIDLLRHENCRGVIAINSNVLHEALLWEKPVLALGDLLASPSAESPLSGDLQAFLNMEDGGKENGHLVDQYLAMLFAYQWTLSDFQNPRILREILSNVDVLVPWTVRSEYGYTS